MSTYAHSANRPAASQERYTWQWFVIGLITLGIVAWAFGPWRQPAFWARVPKVEPGNGVSWFLAVRIPEVPNTEAETAAAKTKVTQWVTGLQQAGFHPMLLSTALSKLDKGEMLPRKSLVLFIHPGSRHTHESLAPIFEQHHIPVVWLTDSKSVNLGDRQYLSRRKLTEMKNSGHWDIAWNRKAADEKIPERITFDLPMGRTLKSASKRMVLDLRQAHAALNNHSGLNVISHLPVRPTWSAQELVDRLSAEVPIAGPAQLTARRIGTRVWGFGIEGVESGERQPFALAAHTDDRTASVSWTCTSGQNDVVLDVNTLSRFGDLWIALRSNPSIGQAVRVGFTQQTIRVEQDHEGVRAVLAEAPWPAPTLDRLSAMIVLHGPRLVVSIQDRPVISVNAIREPSDPNGWVELLVYDQVRGAAAIESASLTLMPLRDLPGARGTSRHAELVDVQLGESK